MIKEDPKSFHQRLELDYGAEVTGVQTQTLRLGFI